MQKCKNTNFARVEENFAIFTLKNEHFTMPRQVKIAQFLNVHFYGLTACSFFVAREYLVPEPNGNVKIDYS